MTPELSLKQPAGFPSDIPVSQKRFTNWDGAIDVKNLWTCTPSSADDVVSVCNWAAGSGYQVRPLGIGHNWSWLVVPSDTAPGSDVLLVDTTANLNQVLSITPASGSQPAQVKVQTGCTMDNLMLALEQAAGGTGAASGYSFPHIPAPGHITVGGVLAIDAHGTAIPAPTEDFPSGYGSMSNRILACTVVSGSTPGTYQLQSFTRGQSGGDDNAFLTHLGRAFLVDVTLEVIQNFNLQCQSYIDINWQTLFAAPTAASPVPANSMASFLNATGRVEAIWYPFSDNPWLKVWTNSSSQPAGSVAVSTPYNYPFSDNLPPFVTGLFDLLLGVPVDLVSLIGQIIEWLLSLGAHSSIRSNAPTPLPSYLAQGWDIVNQLRNFDVKVGWPALTPVVGKLMQLITEIGLTLGNETNLWGPSKNTMIYIKDSTLRVTANGYAISMKKENVQHGINAFVTIFNNLLTAFQAKGQYPVNSPLEIRITGLDNPADIAAANAASPAISALNYDQEAIQNGWDVALWLDVLTLPNTPSSNEFYKQLEDAMNTNEWFTGTNGRLRPEWSKGWAYTDADGAWTNQTFINQIKASFTGWNIETTTLAKYDANSLFTNSFLTSLFHD